MKNYSPQVNIKTSYNFQESLIKIDDYLQFSIENDFKFAFYADDYSMYGAAEFFAKFSQKGIKPIIGLTIYFNNLPLILFAKNKNGFNNLSYISSSFLDETFKKNDFDSFEMVENYFSNDLIYITNNEKIFSRLSNSISDENLFLNKLNLSKISYLFSDQYESFVALSAIKENLTLQEIKSVQNLHYPYDSEILDWNNQNEIILKIANICNFELFNKNKQNIIKYNTPMNIPSYNFLEKLCFESLDSYFKNVKFKLSIDQIYLDRLSYELSVIKKMKFEDYFLVVWDYVKFAKDNNIMVGPGRGSSAGSLVAFLLNITTIDPIKHGLLFERFLNPERSTLPDIDIDFQDDRREEVVEYLFEKYGKYNVATIITYQSIGAKSALRDVSRIYELDLDIVNSITKNISFEFQNNLQGAIKNSESLKEYSLKYENIFKIAETLIGLPRQSGTHAAGIVLSNEDLRNILPIKLGYNGIYQTQFDMNYLERFGLIKMDILGLRNLTTIQEIISNVKKTRNIEIELNKLPLYDPNTFETLKLGNTSGIFQLESPGMTKVVQEIKVNSIEDISIASALFRPGPQEMIPEYLKRKFSVKSKDAFLIDKTLKNILGPTYGIIIYQEQVIQILQKVGGFTLSTADIVRRAMGKKNNNYMQSAKQEFIEGALKNKYNLDKANEIWNWIEKFAMYGFNKSHSIAYSYISYWLAYLKVNYTEEFYCSLLNGVIGNVEKTSQYINELNQYGIKIKGPNIKNLNFNYIGVNKNIFMPLILIKGIGLEFIKKARELYLIDKRIFNSIFLFSSSMVNKGLNKNTFLSLVWSGAFDSFGYNRHTLANNINIIFSFAESNNKLNIEDIDPMLYPLLDSYETIDEDVSNNEREYLGFYLSAHPLTKIRNENATLKTITISRIKKNYGSFRIMGYIDNIRTKNDKNGKEMAFIEITDDTDSIDVTIFGSVFENIKYEFSVGSIIAIEVKNENFLGKQSCKLLKLIKVIKK